MIPPKSTLFYITPKKLPPLPPKYPFHTITSTPQTTLNALTCREPEKTPINLSEGKSLCAFIFKAKPLGLIDLVCKKMVKLACET